ncbi:MAG: hypothetical protein SFY66_28545 [Oculatellaceae cyanobacterium bins.114]|nr:hypothetical protein [Oculatellaceae cyanobacterium bins.114]
MSLNLTAAFLLQTTLRTLRISAVREVPVQMARVMYAPLILGFLQSLLRCGSRVGDYSEVLLQQSMHLEQRSVFLWFALLLSDFPKNDTIQYRQG